MVALLYQMPLKRFVSLVACFCLTFYSYIYAAQITTNDIRDSKRQTKEPEPPALPPSVHPSEQNHTFVHPSVKQGVEEEKIYYPGISTDDAHRILVNVHNAVPLSSLPHTQESYDSMHLYAHDEDVAKAIEICKTYVDPQVLSRPKEINTVQNDVGSFESSSNVAPEHGSVIPQPDVSDVQRPSTENNIPTDDATQTEETVEQETVDEVVDTSQDNGDDKQMEEDSSPGSEDIAVGDDVVNNDDDREDDISDSDADTDTEESIVLPQGPQMKPIVQTVLLPQQSVQPIVQYTTPTVSAIPQTVSTQPTLVATPQADPAVVSVSWPSSQKQSQDVPDTSDSENAAESQKEEDEADDQNANTVITINVNTGNDDVSDTSDSDDVSKDKDDDNDANVADADNKEVNDSDAEFAAATEEHSIDTDDSLDHNSVVSEASSVLSKSDHEVGDKASAIVPIQARNAEHGSDETGTSVVMQTVATESFSYGLDEDNSVSEQESITAEANEPPILQTEPHVFSAPVSSLVSAPIQTVAVVDTDAAAQYVYDDIQVDTPSVISVPQSVLMSDMNKKIGEYAAHMNTREPMIYVDSSNIHRMVTGERMRYTYQKNICDVKAFNQASEASTDYQVQDLLCAHSPGVSYAHVDAKSQSFSDKTASQSLQSVVMDTSIPSQEFSADSAPTENALDIPYIPITAQDVAVESPASEPVIEHAESDSCPIEQPVVSMRLQLALHGPDGMPLALAAARGNPDVTYLQLPPSTITQTFPKQTVVEDSISYQQKQLPQVRVAQKPGYRVVRTPKRVAYVRRPIQKSYAIMQSRYARQNITSQPIQYVPGYGLPTMGYHGQRSLYNADRVFKRVPQQVPPVPYVAPVQPTMSLSRK